MPHLPSADEISAYLTAHGLDDNHQGRKDAAAALVREQRQPSAPAPAGIVLCTSSAQLADGRIETTTTFYPVGETAHEQESHPSP